MAVTPGANPASTGLAVTADLSTIGGSATQQLFDDGTNGDVTSGDNTFSYLATVAAATTPGAKTLTASITDAQARSGSASIGLTVTAAGPRGGRRRDQRGLRRRRQRRRHLQERLHRAVQPDRLRGQPRPAGRCSTRARRARAWQVTNLTGTIRAGGYYLVQEARRRRRRPRLPAPDATGTIAMAADAGKVALVSSTTTLTGACPTGGGDHRLRRLRRRRTASRDGADAGAHATRRPHSRSGGGATDTNNNSTDFTAGAPDPRGTADPAPSVDHDDAGQRHVRRRHERQRHDQLLGAREPDRVVVHDQLRQQRLAHGRGHAGPAASNVGSYQFTLNPAVDFAAVESCTVTVVGAQVSDLDTFDPPDTMAANHVFSFTTADRPSAATPRRRSTTSRVRRDEPDHRLLGGDRGRRRRRLPGGRPVRRLLRPGGGRRRDADPATSEGIFVFSTARPNVSVGDVVRVRGTVTEFTRARRA